MLERVSVMSVLQLWGFDRARAYPGLYPAMYPLSGQQSPHMQRSAALLQAQGFPGGVASMVRSTTLDAVKAVDASPRCPMRSSIRWLM